MSNKVPKSIIGENQNYWSNYYNEKVSNILKRKLFSSLPNISFYKGDKISPEAKKEFFNRIDKLKFWEALNFLIDLQTREGKAVISVELNKDNLFYFNISSPTITSSFKDADNFISTVRTLTRGTFPVLEYTTFTRGKSSRYWEVPIPENLNNSEAKAFNQVKQEFEEMGTSEKPFNVYYSNPNFLNALVALNNPNYDSFEGEPTITGDIRKLISALDLTWQRMIIDIVVRSTTFAFKTGQSSIIGGENNPNFLSDEAQEQIYEKIRVRYENGVRVVLYNGDEETDLDIITDVPEVKPYIEAFEFQKNQIDKLLFIQTGYNSTGVTNDTTSKTDMIGDETSMGFEFKATHLAIQIEQIIDRAMKFIGKDNLYDRISVSLSMIDKRRQMELIKQTGGSILKNLPIAEQFKWILNYDKETANKLFADKNKEVNNSLVSYLQLVNGNLGTNITPKNLTWADIEKEKQNDNLLDSNISDNSKEGDKENGS